MDLAAYDSLIGCIYDAGRGAGSLASMFQQIRTAVGAEAAGVSIYDDGDAVITHTLIGLPSAASRRSLRQIRALNTEPGARMVIGARLDRARRFTDIVPETRLRSLRWYRLQTELTGTGHGIVADTRVSDIRVRLFVTRKAKDQNFDPLEVELLDRLASHLGRGFTGRVRLFSPYKASRELTVLIYQEDRLARSFLTREALKTRFSERFSLSAAEARVLSIIARGASRRVAAAELGIGLNTLKSHMRRIYGKTGARRLPELLLLLQPGSDSDT